MDITILTETITSEKRQNPMIGIFSLLNYESESERNLWDFNLFRKCGLLLWLAIAQHHHCETESERKSGEILFAFPLQKQKQNRISRFSFVIVSVRMVIKNEMLIYAPPSM